MDLFLNFLIMITVFNTKPNQLGAPMFLGESVNVSRYDVQTHPFFEQLIEKQLSFFWRPEEIDVSRDRLDFQNLPEHEKHIFISNLKYQILLDSIQGRSPNMALLPLVSIPELETWVETWSFSECVAENTEVLTTKGWKDISQLKTNEAVLVYDFDNETVHFEKPKRITNYKVDNRLMVELVANNSKQFHQFVTPNHRMPVKNRVRLGHKAKKQFVEAGLWEFKPHNLAPVSGRLIGSSKELTYIQRLLIAAQADGNWKPNRYNGKRVGTVPIWFEFSKKHKIERLIMLAQLANVDIVELSGSNKKGNIKAKRRFKISLPVENIPEDIKDFTSWVNLSECSFEYAEQFLDELSYWDSHVYTFKKGHKTFTYCSTNKNNIDVVQALAVMCNKQARYRKDVDTRKKTYKDLHSVNIVNSSFKDGQSIKKKLVPYTGKVYCIETTTGAFVMRYNNTVSITGNTIHSRSYTHIIRNIVNDPSVVFDDIVENEHILERAKDIAHYYDDLIQYSSYYHLLGTGTHQIQGQSITIDLETLKKKLYMCLMCINVLEAIRFYVSFACSFAFAERELMEGNAKIIRLIARDEALHLASTQYMLNQMAMSDDFKDIAQSCQLEAFELFYAAAEQEKEWAKYLFKDGSMLGLNVSILSNYVEYITNIRMKAVNLPILFHDVKSNPIPWIHHWLNSDSVQSAPQEVELSSYLVGQVDSQIDPDDFSQFEL